MLDKGVTKPTKVKYIYGTDKELKYDAAKHTLTLSGYDNKADGSYVDYTISCTVKENSGKKVFKNQYEVAGKLYNKYGDDIFKELRKKQNHYRLRQFRCIGLQ